MARSPTGPKGTKKGRNTSGRGRAQAEGMRGRAAYKILETDDKYRFLVPGARVVDLGCAPGGWCQVAATRVNALGERSGKKVGTVLGIDLQEVEPVAGCEIHVLDFLDEGADAQVKAWLGGKADVVMSDMAAASSGHKQTDHLRIMALCEAAAYFSFDVLEEGGVFVAKVLAGGAEGDLQKVLKQKFTKVVPAGKTVLKNLLWPKGFGGDIQVGGSASRPLHGLRDLAHG